jgi:hypothetical protein
MTRQRFLVRFKLHALALLLIAGGFGCRDLNDVFCKLTVSQTGKKTFTLQVDPNKAVLAEVKGIGDDSTTANLTLPIDIFVAKDGKRLSTRHITDAGVTEIQADVLESGNDTFTVAWSVNGKIIP